MYLKSLELRGFKSFPEKTVLTFNPGTTVIVGPNGSGKSNITDAMRWVLGELSTKNIRGSKMEDVIFAGTDTRKQMSFAEVSITFDNSTGNVTVSVPIPSVSSTDYDEVTVTRRYYRSGESEYYINKRRCRLKDIYELFINTGIGREGYSIIGQGRIADIVSQKTEERRSVFEESAGIAGFRYQKAEAEKKLDEANSNIERVEDIERELAGRIGPLEKESAKARKYLDIYAEKKKTEVSLWLDDEIRLKGEIEKADEELHMVSHELEMIEDSIKLTENQLENLYGRTHDTREKARNNNDLLTETNRKLGEINAELSRAKSNIERNSVIAEKEEEYCKSADESLAAEKKKLNGLEAEISSSAAEIEKYAVKKAELESEISSAEKLKKELNEKLDGLLSVRKISEKHLADCNLRINVLLSNLQNEEKRGKSIDSDIAKYIEEIQKLTKEQEASSVQLEEYRKRIELIESQISELNSAKVPLVTETEKIRSELSRKQAELSSVDGRLSALMSMQEHFDGYNNSVRYIMNESRAGRLHGIRGPLSYLIKVEKKYIVAIETSLGAALQNIVTEDEAATKSAIEHLKRNDAGRATFYPITTISAQERGRDYNGIESFPGFVGWADELVATDEDYRIIVKYLLARVAVFDNLDNASDAARKRGWKIRAVTLDGQQINAGGSFTGGQTKKDSGMLSRSSTIEALANEKEKLLSENDEASARLKECETKIQAIDGDIKKVSETKSLVSVLSGSEERNIDSIGSRLKSLTEFTENLKRDKEKLISSSREGENVIIKLRDESAKYSSMLSVIDSLRNAIAVVCGETEERISSLNGEISRSSVDEAGKLAVYNSLRNSYDDTAERISRTEAEAEEHRMNVGLLKAENEEYMSQITGAENESARLKAEISKLTQIQTSLDTFGDSLEAQVNSLRATEKEQNSRKEVILISHANAEKKLETLNREEEKKTSAIWEEYELTYATALTFAKDNNCERTDEKNRGAKASRLTELKNELKALGNVNLGSIDEYNEINTRYTTITTQLGDLRAARAELRTIISDIDDNMRSIFAEAFEKINVCFGEVFRELFGGGHAEVVLTDPENILDSGIEINAAPPGKNIRNLNLLSGGEQAFIAIALLFAFIRVNPSPFCIFDEIEASLDEVNVARIGRYIKKYSESMQIIMISHRRGTMDIADTLYGVTMKESGVSKVFTLETALDKESMAE